MTEADSWFACRIAFVETARALASVDRSAATWFAAEWEAFRVVEVDQALVERAAELAIARGLRSLDAIHLSAAAALPRNRTTVATWDRRLRAAAQAEGFAVLPEST
jgi:predicted nucleic acid-binding protein